MKAKSSVFKLIILFFMFVALDHLEGHVQENVIKMIRVLFGVVILGVMGS
jgi:hypothetical protein